LCDRCGHGRADHSAVYVVALRAGCSVIVRDIQSLSAWRCSCPGFEPVRGALRDAGFADPDPDPLTLPLRLVDRDGSR
jgi:hypothetical protein